MHNEYKSVNEVINESAELKKFRTAVEGFEVLGKMNEIFPEISSFVTAKKIENSTLFIRVENSVMRSELYLNKAKMIEKINKYFKKKLVKDIRFI